MTAITIDNNPKPYRMVSLPLAIPGNFISGTLQALSNPFFIIENIETEKEMIRNESYDGMDRFGFYTESLGYVAGIALLANQISSHPTSPISYIPAIPMAITSALKMLSESKISKSRTLRLSDLIN